MSRVRVSPASRERFRAGVVAAHHAAVRAPDAAQPLARRAVLRVLRGRLPAFVAQFPDGRRLRVAAHDPNYAPLFVGMDYEPAESEVVRRVLRPGDFAVDVGGHLGWYSVLMGSLVGPSGRVWTFEPSPPTREVLAENLADNAMPWIELLPQALGADDGRAELHLFAGLPSGHASVSTLSRSDFDTYDVEQRSLDALLDERDAEPPTLIKLDAEGSELAVLRGARRAMSSERPPMWLVEANRRTSAAQGFAPFDLVEEAKRHADYALYRATPHGLEPETRPEEAEDRSWLFVPPAYAHRLAG